MSLPPEPVPHRLTGVDLAVIAVGVVGVSVAAPVAGATLAPALAVAFWRTFAGALFYLPAGLRGLRRRRLRHGPLSRQAVTAVLWSGALLSVHFMLWIPSLRLTSVTASTALVTTTPLWVVLIQRLRGRPVSRRVLVGVLLAFGGVLLITGVDATVSATALLGDAMALAGGAAAAGYSLTAETARREMSTASYSAVANSVCATLTLLVCLSLGVPLLGFDAVTWVEVAVIAVASQIIGHALLNLAILRAGATTVTLAILLETPTASLIAWLWLGDLPPVLVVPGAVLVLLGLAVVVTGRRQPTESPA
ncbi:DMT family transporter [Aquipuribacter sp. MA13-6]|uniref:DMT family transporter n=1 Tax=unclassified Aquipuribacter TaxID=2635084 RepID=UPI003EED6F33